MYIFWKFLVLLYFMHLLYNFLLIFNINFPGLMARGPVEREIYRFSFPTWTFHFLKGFASLSGSFAQQVTSLSYLVVIDLVELSCITFCLPCDIAWLCDVTVLWLSELIDDFKRPRSRVTSWITTLHQPPPPLAPSSLVDTRLKGVEIMVFICPNLTF